MDAADGQAIEDAGLLLAQALVKADGFIGRCAAMVSEYLRCLASAQIGRGKKTLRTGFWFLACKPAAEGSSLCGQV